MTKVSYKDPDTTECNKCRWCRWLVEQGKYICIHAWCVNGSAFTEYQGIYKNGEWK